MISPAASGAAAFGLEPTWTSVEVFTGEQRLTCEVRVSGRLRTRLLDNEPVMRVRNVTTMQSAPSLPRLNAVQDGLLWRQHVVACSAVQGELPDPDAPAMSGRPILLEGRGWTVSAQALFPAAVERERHLDQLMQARFWYVRDVTVAVEWGPAPVTWTMPEAYVNMEQALGVYLG